MKIRRTWVRVVVCLLSGVFFYSSAFGGDKKSGENFSSIRKKAESCITGMRKNLVSIEKVLAEANKRKKVVEVSCVYDKWNKAQGLLQLARSSKKYLDKAVSAGDKVQVLHYSAKIEELGKKTKDLLKQAENCKGEGKGKSKVKVIKGGPKEYGDKGGLDEIDENYPDIPPVSPYR